MSRTWEIEKNLSTNPYSSKRRVAIIRRDTLTMRVRPFIDRFSRCNSIVVRQFIKYALVGIMNSAITLSIIFLMMKILKINYLLSNIVGYCLGLINSFLWNKTWTFRSKGPITKESLIFLFVFAVSYAVQMAALVFLKETCNISIDLAQMISMVIFSIINFIGNKYMSFTSLRKQELS